MPLNQKSTDQTPGPVMQSDSEGTSMTHAVMPDVAQVRLAPNEVDVYRKVRSSLDSGELEPGDRLPVERELAEFYGASRHVIGKAIQRLEKERRIERAVGKGTFVAQPQSETIENSASRHDAGTVSPIDVLEARLVIEPGFSDLLVARATQNDFLRLERLIAALEAATTQQEFREAGYAFHLGLVQTTRNPLLTKIFELIIEARAKAGWGRLQHLNDTTEARVAQAAANRLILDAVKDRDADLTRKLLRGHLGSMLSTVAYYYRDE